MWPSESPIGQRIRFNKVGPWATIVGVYDNARYEIAEPTPPHIYLPAAQHSDVVPGLLLRTSGDATIVVETARQIAKDLLPGELELEAFNVRPLDLEPIADD
jgi:hypothetical protein